MTFKQVKDLLDIGFIPSIIIVPSSNNSNNDYSSDKKVTPGNPLDNPTNNYMIPITSYETWTGEYNEKEITMYMVRLLNGDEFYALNQNDELSDKEPLLSKPEEVK